MSNNRFGGPWTVAKMEIVVSYARAYLSIMNKQKWIKTIYFDGFAGSGMVEANERQEIKKGTALRILDIIEPTSFDLYYFVELDSEFKRNLEKRINENYFGRNAHVVQADCNLKLLKLAEYLHANKNYRALVFIDPYGMSVDWKSIEALKGLGIDLWILVPTGIGVVRLLKNNGEISKSWLSKLERFLGLSKDEIFEHFYKKQEVITLFGAQTIVEKEKDAVTRASELYRTRLNTVFLYVSEAFAMKNATNSIMYHFIMATNNANGLKIATEVIKPKYKL